MPHGYYYRRASNNRSDVAHNHSKAVIERNRNANFVLVLQLHAFPDEQSVVCQIMVSEQRALGSTRSARSVLDIDRVVER